VIPACYWGEPERAHASVTALHVCDTSMLLGWAWASPR